MRLLALVLAVMFNASLVLGAGDQGGRRDRTQKEEEEIVEILEVLEEYELLQDMETLKNYPDLKRKNKGIEEENKPNSGNNKKSEEK